MLKANVDVKTLRHARAEHYAALFEVLFFADDGEPMPPPQFFASPDFENEGVEQALKDFFLNTKILAG
jgi:hypothetical protein